jgi:hypothetical protein
MKRKIAVIPGDGIGPEVTREVARVLDAVNERFESTATPAPLRNTPAVAVTSPPNGDPFTRPPSEWSVTAWRFFVLDGRRGDRRPDRRR